MRYGIDLGGTKIEIIALDGEQEVARKRVASPQGRYEATLSAISHLVLEQDKALGCVGQVGVGIPGSLSRRSGLVKNANSTWLIGQDLQGDLENRLNRPIRLENDANCFALSEASDGAAQGAEVVFGVIIGTGCGGGVVVKGQVLQGLNTIGGEWGHNPLPWTTVEEDKLPCYCGLTGCNETFLSGSGFAQHFYLKTGLKRTAKEIVHLAEQGDKIAQVHLERYCVWLAKGLASVINVMDPDVIVLGGGLSNVAYLYQRVPELWHQWVFSDQVATRLVAPKWGDSSGVRGAAWLWEEEL